VSKIRSASEFSKNTGQMSLWSPTSFSLTGDPTETPPCSPEAFPASPTLAPGSAEAIAMTARSGQKCAALSRKPGPVGSWLRTCLASSVWRSTVCYLTWKVKATKSKRLYFQLAPSTPRIEETGCGLLPTISGQEPGWRHIEVVDRDGNPPEHWNQRFYDKQTGRVVQKGLTQIVRMWPTPDASMGTGGRTFAPGTVSPTGKDLRTGRKRSVPISAAVKLWPTPATRDHHAQGATHNPKGRSSSLATVVQKRPEMWPTPTKQDGANNGGPSQQRRKTPPLNACVLARSADTDSITNDLENTDAPTAAGRGNLLPTPSASMMTAQDMEQAKYAGSDPRRPKYKDVEGSMTGSLNAQFVEILMGFPLNWTDLTEADPNTGTATTSEESPESPPASPTEPPA
jgi:hypothetical protein